MFRSNDFLAEFERLTKGFNLGPAFDTAGFDTEGFDSDSINSVLSDLSETVSGAFSSFTGSGSAGGVDTVRSAERVEFHVDLPGVDPATVDLTVDGRTLTLTANRSFSVPEGSELVTSGRRHGAFSRSFPIGDDLDLDRVSARSEHGVLIVSIPVISSGTARKITISTDPAVIETSAVDTAAVDAGSTAEIDSPSDD